MLIVNDRIRIPLTEFEWSFARSGGPGGQNVNKVESKAVLRWQVCSSPSLPGDVRARFLQKFHTRITGDGEIVMSSQRFRDQERNKQDCLEKLTAMLLEAVAVPKVRRPTKPSKASKRRRVEAKRRLSKTKAGRRAPSGDD
jgi:ribosome-associated protein